MTCDHATNWNQFKTLLSRYEVKECHVQFKQFPQFKQWDALVFFQQQFVQHERGAVIIFQQFVEHKWWIVLVFEQHLFQFRWWKFLNVVFLFFQQFSSATPVSACGASLSA